MKRTIITAATLIGLSFPAVAADLATKYPVKAPVVTSTFSWTGFYIGANAGYGGNTLSLNTITTYDGYYNYTGNTDVNTSGFFAGGQIGYNYQFSNNVVLGVETDLQWSGISGSYNDNYTNGRYLLGSSLEYFGTIRARLGYAFDRFLPYITGGVAYGQNKVSYNYTYYNQDSSSSSTNWGWTIGAGFEYALTNNWTLKTEYMYVDLGSADYSFVPYYRPYLSTGTADASYHTVRAGVNYKF